MSLSAIYAPAIQTQTPTAEQIQIFQNLPPDQQQAILEAIGGGTGDALPSRLPGDATRQDQTTRSTREDERVRREPTERERLEMPDPRLAPGDTLMVELLPLEWEGQERILTPKVEAAQRSVLQGLGAAQPVTTTTAAAGPRPPDAKSIERSPEELAQLKRMIDAVRRGNPYRLTRAGTIDLPGMAPIPIAGLSVYQTTQRMSVEQQLLDVRIRVTLLPLEPPLKPFGYDLFDVVPSTFAPVGDVPVPVDYVVGPGDRLEIQLVGNTKARHRLVVNRDGNINFPELGPIAVSGMRFGGIL